MEYFERINNCRKSYPFDFWLEDFSEGIGNYSEENCKLVREIFDELLKSLIDIGETTEDSIKLKIFEIAVLKLNDIRSMKPELIETMEREEFCSLIDEIAVAAGIEIGKTSVADKWRSW